jgi:catechol 2,3-dioxygenase-like lactoylglutathione lyase family enzyme
MIKHSLLLVLLLIVVSCDKKPVLMTNADPAQESKASMELGAFSVSLTVKDIAKSRAFYEKLGFESVAGDQAQNWLVLSNGSTKIGIFQGMFEKNIMTFNPGWSQDAKPLKKFTDVRELQTQLEKAGIKLTTRADPKSEGPASIVFSDPDGNTILFDQHVPKPTDK